MSEVGTFAVVGFGGGDINGWGWKEGGEIFDVEMVMCAASWILVWMAGSYRGTHFWRAVVVMCLRAASRLWKKKWTLYLAGMKIVVFLMLGSVDQLIVDVSCCVWMAPDTFHHLGGPNLVSVLRSVLSPYCSR
jgi:hypothetical protein